MSSPDQHSADQESPDQPGDQPRESAVGGLVSRWVDAPLAGRAPTAPEQGRELGRLVRALADSGRSAGRASVLGGGWLADLLLDVAPRLRVRDLATLQRHHPGLEPDDLAEVLVAGAAKASGAVGAAGGALAAVQFTAPPTLLTTPVQLAAETLLVAAIEVKLIAELHEVYGAPVTGPPARRMQSYVMAWTERRGIDPLAPGSLRASFGQAAKRSLRNRMVRRAGRNLTTLGPMMSGAVAGSVVNHRETRRVGGQVRDDLRRMARPPR